MVTQSESLIGLAFGTLAFAAMAAQPITGWLLDRFGRRGVQAIVAVAFAATTLVFT